MTKLQKVWMWLSLAMFLVPEVLFFTTPALLMSFSGESFSQISSLVINYKFFLNYPIYLLIVIVVEFLGVLGLFLLSIKSNKILTTILSFAILLWLIFIFAIVYITGFSMSF